MSREANKPKRMTSSEHLRKKLRGLADAQQNKIWVRDDGRLSLSNGHRMYGVKGPLYVSCYEDYGFTRESASFIATANPEAVTALLDELDATELERDEAYRHAGAAERNAKHLESLLQRYVDKHRCGCSQPACTRCQEESSIKAAIKNQGEGQ